MLDSSATAELSEHEPVNQAYSRLAHFACMSFLPDNVGCLFFACPVANMLYKPIGSVRRTGCSPRAQTQSIVNTGTLYCRFDARHLHYQLFFYQKKMIYTSIQSEQNKCRSPKYPPFCHHSDNKRWSSHLTPRLERERFQQVQLQFSTQPT